VEKWKQFWFEPVDPANLGICRILFFGMLFLLYLPHDFSQWSEVSQAFWMPSDLFKFGHLSVGSGHTLVVIQIIWKIALLFSCVGLFTRLSTITALIFGAYLIGLAHSFGKVQHDDAIVAISIGVMALSRCGDSFSIDAMISRARQRQSVHAKQSGEYKWPVQIICVLFSLAFFSAGISKLRHGGMNWIFSDSLAILLVRHHYHVSDSDPLVSWGLNLAQHPFLYKTLALLTVAGEVGYPLALFSFRARRIFVPLMLLIQLGIRVVMGPSFNQFLICNLFWVPWDRVFNVKR
jgi:hypothetical protein